MADAVWQYKNDRNPRKTPGATRRPPVSPDFEPIVVTGADEAELQVLAELVEVLGG